MENHRGRRTIYECGELSSADENRFAGRFAFEALNHIGSMGLDILVVLNDNDMSISEATGAFSKSTDTILQWIRLPPRGVISSASFVRRRSHYEIHWQKSRGMCHCRQVVPRLACTCQ